MTSSRHPRSGPALSTQELKRDEARLDVHLHWPVRHSEDSPYAAWNLTETEFVEHLDLCGIQRGVVHAVAPRPGAEARDLVAANREILRLRDRFPGRFTGACVLEPYFIEESLREMEDWKHRFGMVWVAETPFPARRSASLLQAFDRIMQQASKLDMIISVDTDPEGMDYILQQHPDTTVVFPRLEKGPAPQRIEAVGRGHNLYLDISPRGYERMGLIEVAAETLASHQILFGSNFPINDPAAVIARVENAFLRPDQKRAIFSSNATALLEQAGWKF